jgi:excisionase family DNA binding protein
MGVANTSEPHETHLGTVTVNRLLDYAGAAELLGVKPRTIRTLAESHRIDTVKVGYRVRIEQAALERFVAANRIPATKPSA